MADPTLDEWITAELAQCEGAKLPLGSYHRALTLLQQHRAALRKLFALVEDGTLVRDISRDDLRGWAMRQIPLVKTLAEVSVVLAEKP